MRGISYSSINRLAASFRASAAQRERERLIQQQSDVEKELEPEYDLYDVDFDSQTRITKITFLCTKYYRTIDRYVTQDYQRYPIYSDWKIKKSYIKKRIKLTNQNLEQLNFNDDDLISDFSSEIILKLNDPELIPSWLAIEIIKNDFYEYVDSEKQKEKSAYENYLSIKHTNEEKIKSSNDTISNLTFILNKKTLKLEKVTNRIQKIELRKKSIFLSIVTLFIYSISRSNFRKNRLVKKQIKFENQIAELNLNIAEQNKSIQAAKNEIENSKHKYETISKETKDNIKKLTEKELADIKSVQPLGIEHTDTDFVPLKKFIGYEYEKIIGCYIIKNNEKDRYYVGQSKDVVKRIRQHFRGTVPNNIIFAEDYFNSINKENLFSIKIIRLNTKDELDRNEKRLIEEYDANITGYNSTKGNS